MRGIVQDLGRLDYSRGVQQSIGMEFRTGG